jgi:hypothetical protein
MSKGVSVGELVGGPYCILLTANFHIKNTPNLVNRAFTLIYSTSFGVSLVLLGLHETYPKWTKKGERIKERTKQRRNRKKPNPTYTIRPTHTSCNLGRARSPQAIAG